MANSTMGIPLAEAVVMLRLVHDKNETKNSIVKALAPIATLVSAGMLGIRKYLLTTDKGAVQLRYSMAALSRSWDQFLARIGRVIANSGVLQAIFSTLAKVLNSLDDTKIKTILKVASWIAILSVVKNISKLIAGWKVGSLAVSAAKGAASSAAGSAIGAGAGAVGATGALAAILIEIKAILKFIKTSFQIILGVITSVFYFMKMGGVKTFSGTFGAIAYLIGLAGKELKTTIPILSKFSAFLGKLFKIGLVLDVVVGSLRGLGLAVDSVGGLLLGFFSIISKVFESLSVLIQGGAEAVTRFLTGQWKGLIEEVGGGIDKKMKEIWGDKKKDKDMKWLNQSVTTSSFEGLMGAAQSMITLDNQLKATKENTEAVKENTAAKKAEANGKFYETNKNNPTASPFVDAWNWMTPKRFNL